MRQLIKRYYVSFAVGVLGALVAEFTYFNSPSGPYYTSPMSSLLQRFDFHQSMWGTIAFDILAFYVPLLLIYGVVAIARKTFFKIDFRQNFSFLFFSLGTFVGEVTFGVLFVTTINFGFAL